MKIRGRSLVASCLLLVLALPAQAADDRLDDLLKMVPDSANAVVAINVWGLRNSPLGKKQNWAQKQEQNYLAGQSNIPPAASNLVVAAQLDSHLRSPYTVALARVDVRVPLDKLAHAEKSEPDEVAGKPVYLSPRDVYFVQLSPEVIGAMKPANRQSLSRWINASGKTAASTLSNYLAKAISNPDNYAPIVMAVDLADVVDPAVIRRGLNVAAITKIIGEKKADFDKVVYTLSKMRGATFKVQVDEEMNGEFEVEFSTSSAPLHNLVKPLTIEIFEELGIRFDDMEDWKIRLKDQAVGLRGKLSNKGLRQVLSILHAPATASGSAEMTGSPGSTPASTAAESSQRYFSAVTQSINDLKTMKGQNVKGYATWYDRYSQQIESLPVLNVDPELIAYGGKVASQLRAVGASLQGVDLKSSYLDRQKGEWEFQTAPSYQYGYGYGWGYGAGYGAYYPSMYGSVNNFDQVHQQQDELVTKSKAGRVVVLQQIDDETAEIRRKMTAKYMVEFTAYGTGPTQRTIKAQDR
jgi:hypothetical protein